MSGRCLAGLAWSGASVVAGMRQAPRAHVRGPTRPLESPTLLLTSACCALLCCVQAGMPDEDIKQKLVSLLAEEFSKKVRQSQFWRAGGVLPSLAACCSHPGWLAQGLLPGPRLAPPHVQPSHQ